MVRVKICGITTVQDAKAAMDLGADAIGVIFARSPRRVTQKLAAQISRAVGPWIAVLGVFVDEAPAEIRRLVRECHLSAVQLHGRETPKRVESLEGVKVIKAFHVSEGFRPSEMAAYRSADAFLFDTKVPGQSGGTGVIFDWKILDQFRSDKPFIISGGLHPGNVAQAIRYFKPYGVEVSSGVEKSAGKKDLKKIREFIRNAKKS